MEVAIKVVTKGDVQKLNKKFGTNEKEYPAMYVNIHGEMQKKSLSSEEFLTSIGYIIVSLA